MNTLIKVLWGMVAYMTENCHDECLEYLGEDLFNKLDMICIELGEWLNEHDPLLK